MLLGLLVDFLLHFGGLRVASRLLGVSGLRMLYTRSDARAAPGRTLLARLAGPVAIYLFAATLFFVSARLEGVATTSVSVLPGSPAETAGIRSGDRIVEVDGTGVSTYEELRDRLRDAGDEIDLRVARDGATSQVRVTRSAGAPLGLASGGAFAPLPLSSALRNGVVGPFHAITSTWSAVANELVGNAPARPAVGPVATARMLEQTNAAAPRSRLAPMLAWLATVCASVWPAFVLLAVISMRRVRAAQNP